MDLKYRRFCKQCNKEFYINPRTGINWVLKNNLGIFCSHTCHNISRKGKRVSIATEFTKEKVAWDKHPRFINGKYGYDRFRKDTCEDCGVKEDLQVHHKDKDRNNNLITNLRTLCRTCHSKNHKGKVPWNKGKKMPQMSSSQKNNISQGLLMFYQKNDAWNKGKLKKDW